MLQEGPLLDDNFSWYLLDKVIVVDHNSDM